MLALKAGPFENRLLMRLMCAACALAFVLAILPGGFAAETTGSETAVAAQAGMPDDDFLLGPGDDISVEDANMGAFTTGQMRILEDGTVDLPMIGQVRLSGLTPEAAQAFLNEQYKTFFVAPAITVRVLSPHPVRVYVKGAVNNPGVQISGKNTGNEDSNRFDLTTSPDRLFYHRFYLTDALMQAGGLMEDADLRNIVVHRSAPEAQDIRVNLWALFKTGDTAQDLSLRQQDVIEVPRLPHGDVAALREARALLNRSNLGRPEFTVNVIGAVEQPGSYEVTASDSALSAIAQAGGFSEMAKRHDIYLLRANDAGQIFKTRINATDAALVSRKKSDPIALLPDDVIFVDESGGRRLARFLDATVDRATGPALLPLFSEMLRKDE